MLIEQNLLCMIICTCAVKTPYSVDPGNETDTVLFRFLATAEAVKCNQTDQFDHMTASAAAPRSCKQPENVCIL